MKNALLCVKVFLNQNKSNHGETAKRRKIKKYRKNMAARRRQTREKRGTLSPPRKSDDDKLSNSKG
ncbi:hypothetical protein RAH42_12620 [Pyramidobacter sp. YE332]|uniref:hypothetical protein n=1 Tax=Pyramidobacter sp. YE332 TaxID=3068894 RepID=UPI00294B819B|nr:hypothetical protein [Pyramidobacter sp. YE332]WOL39963.1 hypothetical protein RAH42_12620 [Pyramidobacter sp. YE332]